MNAALNGAAAPVPPPAASLKVEFENYDGGGQNVGYSDTTSSNSGGAYRSDGVDIQKTTDTGGGYDVGWVKATEWLDYTVSIPATGTYSIDVRVACNGSGGAFHIEVDGVNATGSMDVPNTGGWQAWTTVTRSGVSLTAGSHLVRVVMDTNSSSGSVGNFNWFAIR
jgi:hypothetical protein